MNKQYKGYDSCNNHPTTLANPKNTAFLTLCRVHLQIFRIGEKKYYESRNNVLIHKSGWQILFLRDIMDS